MRTLLPTLSPALRDQRGSAAIEFGIIAPVLALVLIATVELGFAMRARMIAQEAASAGALYASQHAFDAAGITGIMAATANASNEATITAGTPTAAYGCPTTTAVTPAAQGDICSDGKPARRYVTVTATVPRVSILGSDLGLPANLTSTSVVRLPS